MKRTLLYCLVLAVLSWLSVAAAPVNDNLANAVVITDVSSPLSGSNVDATKETGEPEFSAFYPGGKSVWWSWTPTQAGRFAVSTKGSSFPALIGIYTGTTVSKLTLVVSNDAGMGFLASTVAFTAATNKTYQIGVDGKYGASGNITLAISGPLVAPTNDAFAKRLAITGMAATVTGSNVGATREASEPAHGGYTAGSSVWWTWTAPDSTGVTLDLAGTTFNPVVAVYRGTSLSALTLVAAGGTQVSFAATSNTVYQVAVDGRDWETGDIQMNLTTSTPDFVVSQQPQPQTVTELGAVLFTAKVTGLAPLGYQWQFYGTNLPKANSPTLVLRGVSGSQAGPYRLLVTNSFTTVTTSEATLTVLPDTTAPTIVSARTAGRPNQVVVVFSEPVLGSSIANPANYTIDNGITVSNAVQDLIYSNTVVLTCSKLSAATAYLLSVSGVSDFKGNTIASGFSISLDQQPVILAELGQDVSGFQDDFDGATRDPNWVAVGPGGDFYLQANGALKISSQQGDPNHLLYVAPGYDDSVQEVVTRIRVTRFVAPSGNDDPPRGGPAVTVEMDSARGLNLHFRFQSSKKTVKFLDDLRAWGTETAFPWTMEPKLSSPRIATDGSFQVNINGPWYWMRLHREPAKGTASALVAGKIWPSDGVTPEPTTWMQWSDTQTPPRAGFAGIAGSSNGGLAETEVDYILIKALGLPTIKVAPKAYAGTYDLQVASPDFTRWSSVTNISSLNATATDPRVGQPTQGFYRAVLQP